MGAPRVFSMDMNVRFRDLDAMGHVNNAVFFTYFEQVRIRFFQEIFHILDPSDNIVILASITCNFLKAITLEKKLTVQMGVTAIGRKSFTLNYQIVDRLDKTIVYATGESIQVWYDYGAEQTFEISQNQREKLTPFLSAGGEAPS
jgi:acyl-CoA thioester hydrolase